MTDLLPRGSKPAEEELSAKDNDSIKRLTKATLKAGSWDGGNAPDRESFDKLLDTFLLNMGDAFCVPGIIEALDSILVKRFGLNRDPHHGMSYADGMDLVRIIERVRCSRGFASIKKDLGAMSVIYDFITQFMLDRMDALSEQRLTYLINLVGPLEALDVYIKEALKQKVPFIDLKDVDTRSKFADDVDYPHLFQWVVPGGGIYFRQRVLMAKHIVYFQDLNLMAKESEKPTKQQTRIKAGITKDCNFLQAFKPGEIIPDRYCRDGVPVSAAYEADSIEELSIFDVYPMDENHVHFSLGGVLNRAALKQVVDLMDPELRTPQQVLIFFKPALEEDKDKESEHNGTIFGVVFHRTNHATSWIQNEAIVVNTIDGEEIYPGDPGNPYPKINDCAGRGMGAPLEHVARAMIGEARYDEIKAGTDRLNKQSGLDSFSGFTPEMDLFVPYEGFDIDVCELPQPVQDEIKKIVIGSRHLLELHLNFEKGDTLQDALDLMKLTFNFRQPDPQGVWPFNRDTDMPFVASFTLGFWGNEFEFEDAKHLKSLGLHKDTETVFVCEHYVPLTFTDQLARLLFVEHRDDFYIGCFERHWDQATSTWPEHLAVKMSSMMMTALCAVKINLVEGHAKFVSCSTKTIDMSSRGLGHVLPFTYPDSMDEELLGISRKFVRMQFWPNSTKANLDALRRFFLTFEIHHSITSGGFCNDVAFLRYFANVIAFNPLKEPMFEDPDPHALFTPEFVQLISRFQHLTDSQADFLVVAVLTAWALPTKPKDKTESCQDEHGKLMVLAPHVLQRFDGWIPPNSTQDQVQQCTKLMRTLEATPALGELTGYPDIKFDTTTPRLVAGSRFSNVSERTMRRQLKQETTKQAKRALRDQKVNTTHLPIEPPVAGSSSSGSSPPSPDSGDDDQVRVERERRREADKARKRAIAQAKADAEAAKNTPEAKAAKEAAKKAREDHALYLQTLKNKEAALADAERQLKLAEQREADAKALMDAPLPCSQVPTKPKQGKKSTYRTHKEKEEVRTSEVVHEHFVLPSQQKARTEYGKRKHETERRRKLRDDLQKEVDGMNKLNKDVWTADEANKHHAPPRPTVGAVITHVLSEKGKGKTRA